MKLNTLILGLLLVAFIGQLAVADNPDKPNVPVSYTHLTLPTIYSV